jgi:hypothetical protein
VNQETSWGCTRRRTRFNSSAESQFAQASTRFSARRAGPAPGDAPRFSAGRSTRVVELSGHYWRHGTVVYKTGQHWSGTRDELGRTSDALGSLLGREPGPGQHAPAPDGPGTRYDRSVPEKHRVELEHGQDEWDCRKPHSTGSEPETSWGCTRRTHHRRCESYCTRRRTRFRAQWSVPS